MHLARLSLPDLEGDVDGVLLGAHGGEDVEPDEISVLRIEAIGLREGQLDLLLAEGLPCPHGGDSFEVFGRDRGVPGPIDVAEAVERSFRDRIAEDDLAFLLANEGSDLERALLWKGRKNAIPALGRLAPDDPANGSAGRTARLRS